MAMADPDLVRLIDQIEARLVVFAQAIAAAAAACKPLPDTDPRRPHG